MSNPEIATLGGGCFWCLEAVFDDMKGVLSVESGYMGGFVDNPTYKDVCTGRTGHAEVVQVTFDPEVSTYREVLEVFFAIHDPTTLNRQGNDVGTQYRSAIFHHSEEQRKVAEDVIRTLDEEGGFDTPIVTEVLEASKFYLAEDYHQEYFQNNQNAHYCSYIVAPKVKKFHEYFAAKLRRRA
jgi:peptide-methionine (S)-S-oxide reductase